MKTFIIFAVICFNDPKAVTGMTCLNFWEEPITHYKTELACIKASQMKGDDIKYKFERDGIKIQELIMWCIPSKKVDI